MKEKLDILNQILLKFVAKSLFNNNSALALKRWQVITWNNDNLVHLCYG